MQFDVKFKGIDHSDSLENYVRERCEKLKKFEIKPIRVHVTFSLVRHERKAEFYIHGLHKKFRAAVESDSYFTSLDACLKKISRQMEKEKEKIKHHHHYEASAEAQLEVLARLEERGRRAA